MDHNILTLLPKGIVTNNTGIYDEVARYTVVPPDKVYEYWHVYTITNKKLKDPTSRRLENFWWHVWGSDRRALSGRALARIFEDISIGPTVVPLRGPANRWEGSEAALLTVEEIVAHLRAGALPSTKQLVAAATGGGDGGLSPVLSSASSRRAQPPLISKKNDHDSPCRLQQHASNISPQESADEGDSEDHAPSPQRTLARVLESPSIHSNKGDIQCQKPDSIADPVSAHPKCATESGYSNLAACASDIDRESNLTSSMHSSAQNRQDTRRGGQQTSMRRNASLFTGATASTTKVAAQGTIIDQSGSADTLSESVVSDSFSSGQSSALRGAASPALTQSRLIPTQPSSSTSLPLGHTKSQLTLLLERDRERTRDG